MVEVVVEAVVEEVVEVVEGAPIAIHSAQEASLPTGAAREEAEAEAEAVAEVEVEEAGRAAAIAPRAIDQLARAEVVEVEGEERRRAAAIRRRRLAPPRSLPPPPPSSPPHCNQSYSRLLRSLPQHPPPLPLLRT